MNGTLSRAGMTGAALIGLTLAPSATGQEAELLAHWKLDGTTTDASGNGHDGTLTGGAVYVPGVRDEALEFDANSQVLVPHDPRLDLGTGDFTISCWLNFWSHGGEQVIIEKCDGTCGTAGWTMTSFDAGNGDRILHFNGGFDAFFSQPLDFDIGEYHHVAWERSGDTFRVYHDGLLAEEWTSSGDLSQPTADLWLGRRNTADGRDFDLRAELDDVRIYSAALSVPLTTPNIQLDCLPNYLRSGEEVTFAVSQGLPDGPFCVFLLPESGPALLGCGTLDAMGNGQLSFDIVPGLEGYERKAVAFAYKPNGRIRGSNIERLLFLE